MGIIFIIFFVFTYQTLLSRPSTRTMGHFYNLLVAFHAWGFVWNLARFLFPKFVKTILTDHPIDLKSPEREKTILFFLIFFELQSIWLFHNQLDDILMHVALFLWIHSMHKKVKSVRYYNFSTMCLTGVSLFGLWPYF